MPRVCSFQWLAVLLSVTICCVQSFAQGRGYAGGVAGFAILAADGASLLSPESGAMSSYDPATGAALNLFAGVHFSNYVSFQANYIWNRNSLALSASRFGQTPAEFYEQSRSSSHHSAIADVLLYFRNRESWARPYLSTGVGVTRFRSRLERRRITNGAPEVPPDDFSSTFAVLRVAVGLDVRMHGPWYARYSFSESISGNPISDRLSPPGDRALKNFQNLFGLFRTF